MIENGRASAKWDSAKSERQRLRSDHLVFLYGRYRRVLLPGEPEERKDWTDGQWLDDLASHAAQARTTVTRADNRLLQDVAGYLRGLNLARNTDARFEALWAKLNDTLAKLDPKLAKIEMVEGPYHLIPKVIREGTALELAQLSDGYQAMLVIVLDLMLRYAFLFFEGNPLEGKALVGIDEIDLHLHPRWQRTILSSLTDLFPNTQFVLTTHSPIVVQAAIDQGYSVVRLTETNGAVTAKPFPLMLMKSLRGAEVSSVLFEDHLFGTDSRFSVEFEAVERRVDELQSQIASGEASKKDYQEFAKRGMNSRGLSSRKIGAGPPVPPWGRWSRCKRSSSKH